MKIFQLFCDEIVEETFPVPRLYERSFIESNANDNFREIKCYYFVIGSTKRALLIQAIGFERVIFMLICNIDVSVNSPDLFARIK
jgi:hypothetical protein